MNKAVNPVFECRNSYDWTIGNHPFPTPSGKIEIFSTRLWDMKKPREIPAVPKYIAAWEEPEDPLREKYLP